MNQTPHFKVPQFDVTPADSASAGFASDRARVFTILGAPDRGLGRLLSERAVFAGAVFAGAVFAGAVLTGCGSPVADSGTPTTDQVTPAPPPEAALVMQLPADLDPDRWGLDRLADQQSVARGEIRELTFQSQTAGWKIGRVDGDHTSGVRLVQTPVNEKTGQESVPPIPKRFGESDPTSDDPAGPSASDIGPFEVIPTPPARPEIKAEMIPKPQGFPEGSLAAKPTQQPLGPVVSDPDSKTATEAISGPASNAIESTDAGPGKPALIDATRELGLVAARQGPEDYTNWPKPDALLFVTGNQHGYIEPCGCTGLENQKGGVARRFTFMDQLRQKGWPLVPVDAGNQIRRIGQQAAIKFEKSASALSQMNYQSVGFGPGDMRLGATDLIRVTYAESPDDAIFVSANVMLLDPELLPTHKLIKRGEWNIGLTSILDPEALEAPVEDEVVISPPADAAKAVLAKMNAAGATYRVVTFYGEEKAAKELMAEVPGYDLIVVSGGYGEPTYRPESIDGSKAKMIVTGNKGMYVGLVGLYDDQDMKYARVPLTHEFKDAPEMRTLMAEYQKELEQLGLSGLGISPIPHPSGNKYVGTATCGKCHTEAMEVWETSPHAEATADIVKPTEQRGDVPRHFDPECLSCHVTGWNPQEYYPYETGYLSLEKSAHLTGSGCENCHGPGAEHSAAEEADSDVSEQRRESLRLAMRLPLEKAREHCMKCHDLDNSPDFHEEDAFEDEYWPQVEHYGMD